MILALYVFAVGCPIYRLFAIPCPGCGMTRAFFAALRFDFCVAFGYHPLFPLLIIETAYVLFRGFAPKKYRLCAKIETVVGVASIALLLIVWIYRRFIVHTI